MASENDYSEYTQNVKVCNVDLLPEKMTELKQELSVSMTQNVLDLSCKNRTKSSLTNLRDLMNTYSSLTSTTDDQYEQPNASDAERNSPYGTVLMSPYSDTNSPKRRKLSEPTAVVNNFTNNFTNNYSSNIVVPSAITPHMYRPPHLLLSNESINDIPKEIFPTSSSLPTSFAQISQSLPLGETPRIIPQTFSPIKILQSAVALPGEIEMSAAQSETKKVTRPFKALPKDSMYFNKDDFEKYMKFKNQMMQSVKKINEHSNPKMRRTSNSPALPNSTVEEKDAAYWERRKKNNAAAKRSRDARRAKEDELAIRAAFFQNENQILKSELQYMRSVLMLYNIQVDLPKRS